MGNNLKWLSDQKVSFDLVSDPNWHTPSLLTRAEILRALEHFGLEVVSVPGEFQAILEAMKTLEGHYGEGRTRLVFWFDN